MTWDAMLEDEGHNSFDHCPGCQAQYQALTDHPNGSQT